MRLILIIILANVVLALVGCAPLSPKGDYALLDGYRNKTLRWARQAGVLIFVFEILVSWLVYAFPNVALAAQSATKAGASFETPSVGVFDVSQTVNDVTIKAATGTGRAVGLNVGVQNDSFVRNRETSLNADREYAFHLGFVGNEYARPKRGRVVVGYNSRANFHNGCCGVSAINVMDFGRNPLILFYYLPNGFEVQNFDFGSVGRIKFISAQTQSAISNDPQSEREKRDGKCPKCGDGTRISVERNSLTFNQNKNAGAGILLCLVGLIGMFISYAALIRR